MFGIKCKYNKCLPAGRQGFTIIEILVVIAVFVTAFVSLLGFFALDIRVSERNRSKLQALSLAEESIEVVRFVRDNYSWSATLGVFSLNTNYHPAINGSTWSIVSGSGNVGEFNRKIIFSAVSRDANDNIENVYNPINNDIDTRKVTTIVSWADRSGVVSESLSVYLTNWK
ncbi:MAG: type II secretion system protein [Patescibacteria group bacterium]